MDTVGRPSAQRRQRPLRVVQLGPGARHLAGVAAQQVQRVVRLPARVQLLRRHAGQRAGSDQRLQVPAEHAHAGDVELAADQPSAPRSGVGVLDLAVERVLAPGRLARHHPGHRPDAGRQLRGADHLPRLAEPYRPLFQPLLGHLRHRHALVQGRHAERGAGHQRAVHHQRQRELHVPQRRSDQHHAVLDAVSAQGPRQRLRGLRAGSVERRTIYVPDGHPLRLVLRLGAGAEHARRHLRLAGRAEPQRVAG